MTEPGATVAVLGASPKPERHSHRAVERLQAAGYDVIPVRPAQEEILGLPCVDSLAAIDRPVDTVTVYVSAERSAELAGSIAEAGPRRVIFNPGAENPALAARLREAGVEVLEACTLVLLASGRF
jgi:predicted CoA-binding protein